MTVAIAAPGVLVEIRRLVVRMAELAGDCFVTVTASVRTLYVFVVLDVGTRRIVHWNVTEHPWGEPDKGSAFKRRGQQSEESGAVCAPSWPAQLHKQM